MAFVKSKNIIVYPSTGRVNFDSQSRYSSEFNITNLSNRLSDIKSYVITSNYSYELEFVINGYYFKITDPADIPSGNVYAHICIKDVQSTLDNSTVFQTLYTNNSSSGGNLDYGSTTPNFVGLVLDGTASYSPPSGTTGYTLQLLEYVNGVQRVPSKSKTRFILDDGVL